MKTFITFICIFTFNLISYSQTTIYGKITDEASGEELIYANIVLEKNGVFAAGKSTDFDGNYSIHIDPGTYDLKVSYTGYSGKQISGVIVKAGQATKLDIKMTQGVSLDCIVVTEYKIPLIEQDNTTSGGTISSHEIKNLSKRNISALAATTSGLSKADEGRGITVRGSRANASDYFIDGIRVRGSAALTQSRNAKPLNLNENLLGGTPATIENQNVTPKKNRNDTPVSNFSQEEYEKIVENDFKNAKEEQFSTFSIDVDNASYSNIRRYIQYGQTPNPHAVRIEEMINYFEYDYPQPEGDKPFSINTELGDCPWNKEHKLLHIGLQGADLKMDAAESNNLVFLIDVSGSMSSPNKLPLLKRSFALLIDQLRPEDQVAIAVYAGAAGLVLPSTFVKDKNTILAALNNLSAGGSTAGGEGINLAYKTAIDNLLEDGNNRVILATDGDFNVGPSSTNDLHKLIEEKRKSGVYLSVLGFGMGNLKDNRLETLADKGNGHYAYIDNIKEATKVFKNQLTSTLYTIAKDVKLQLVFNSKNVESYRLIGYENRLLAKEDFDDDKKDAGELGAGHTVTAIYELELKSNSIEDDLMEVKFRYKRPKEKQSRFITHTVFNNSKNIENTSNDFRFSAAVAAFGMILKGSKYLGDADCQMITELAEDATRKDPFGYRKEFLSLVNKYETMTITSQK